MGAITFISKGLAKTIHENGDITIEPTEFCDFCQKEQTRGGGLTVSLEGQNVLWKCYSCLNPA